jgi:hypothetical protein
VGPRPGSEDGAADVLGRERGGDLLHRTDRNGGLLPGEVWPAPRSSGHGDGPATEMTTGDKWLENGNCFGFLSWTTAVSDANTLQGGLRVLSDRSEAGDWQLPTVNDLRNFLNLEFVAPALSGAAGTPQGSEGDESAGVKAGPDWTSSTDTISPSEAWFVDLGDDRVDRDPKNSTWHGMKNSVPWNCPLELSLDLPPGIAWNPWNRPGVVSARRIRFHSSPLRARVGGRLSPTSRCHRARCTTRWKGTSSRCRT